MLNVILLLLYPKSYSKTWQICYNSALFISTALLLLHWSTEQVQDTWLTGYTVHCYQSRADMTEVSINPQATWLKSEQTIEPRGEDNTKSSKKKAARTIPLTDWARGYSELGVLNDWSSFLQLPYLKIYCRKSILLLMFGSSLHKWAADISEVRTPRRGYK